MYQFKRDGISVSAVLDRRITNKKGEHHVKICVIYKRVSKYYATEQYLSDAQWEELSKNEDMKSIRRVVKSRFELVAATVIELMRSQTFSFDNLKQELHKRISPSYYVDNTDDSI